MYRYTQCIKSVKKLQLSLCKHNNENNNFITALTSTSVEFQTKDTKEI